MTCEEQWAHLVSHPPLEQPGLLGDMEDSKSGLEKNKVSLEHLMLENKEALKDKWGYV